MKATVDQGLCIGCGLCPSIAPDVFEMQDDGKAHPTADSVPGGSEDDSREAADSCPTNAIGIE